jgi:hypothetical protein
MLRLHRETDLAEAMRLADQLVGKRLRNRKAEVRDSNGCAIYTAELGDATGGLRHWRPSLLKSRLRPSGLSDSNELTRSAV